MVVGVNGMSLTYTHSYMRRIRRKWEWTYEEINHIVLDIVLFMSSIY